MVRALPASTAHVQSQSTESFTKNYNRAERILQSFNTWAFKREQPSNPKLMLASVLRALERHEPVRFVLYWGKGPRHALAAPDVQCLDYLSALARRVREAYPKGASINLLFTDTHAELNGYLPEEIEQYFSAVEDAARERGFAGFRLGRIAKASADSIDCSPYSPFPAETLWRLSRCAEKWYKGEGTAESGALKYFEMNMREKRAVEQAFPHSIFITFNSSEYRILFPDRLPIFYMYSLKKGVAVKPWFLSVEAPASLDVAAQCCDSITTPRESAALDL
jgi:hypothetical protein